MWKALAGYKRWRHLGYLGQFVCMYFTVSITRLYREVWKLGIASAAGQSSRMDNWNIHAVQVKTVALDCGEPRTCLVVLHIPFQPLSPYFLLCSWLILSSHPFDFVPLWSLLTHLSVSFISLPRYFLVPYFVPNSNSPRESLCVNELRVPCR